MISTTSLYLAVFSLLSRTLLSKPKWKMGSSIVSRSLTIVSGYYQDQVSVVSAFVHLTCTCFFLIPSQNAKTDTLLRLYEMDEHPERRMFLDKLLHFMEERGTPIAQCPTISKNPLDLFRLYVYTKERGGFMEVKKEERDPTQKSRLHHKCTRSLCRNLGPDPAPMKSIPV